jgi:hypothetical protein
VAVGGRVSVAVAVEVGVGLALSVTTVSVGDAVGRGVRVADAVAVGVLVKTGAAVGVGAARGWLRSVSRMAPMKPISSADRIKIETMRKEVEFTQSSSRMGLG